MFRYAALSLLCGLAVGQPAEEKKPPEPMESLWSDLAGLDAPRAFRAIGILSNKPKEALALFKTKLRPVPPLNTKLLEQSIKDLGDSRYAVRQKAMGALAAMDTLARPALVALLKKPVPPEVRRRAESLLKDLEGPISTSRLLGPFRAMEVLERIGSPEARDRVAMLARGAPGHRITEEARSTLERLVEKLRRKENQKLKNKR